MPATQTFGLNTIGQIAVNVRNLERARGFYRNTLGMRFLADAPRMAFFDCGGIRLVLTLPESPQFDHPASIIYYRVEDIGAAYETLVARGVHFGGEPHWVADLGDRELWLAFFEDGEGNLLALVSEPRKSATA
jgi:methylmalonyl-CoA/ethylmalonyl-CoA epimerase